MNKFKIKLDKNKFTKARVVYNTISAIIALALFFIILFREKLFVGDDNVSKLLLDIFSTGEIESEKYPQLVLFLRVLEVIILVYGAVCLAKIMVLFADKETDNRKKTWLLLIGNACKYFCIIVGFISILAICGVDTTALVASAGVLTLIVGLGCQSLVSDLVAGMFIMFEGNFVIGDIIVVDGFRGTVKKIGLRTTSIEDSVGNIKTINNSHLTDVINNSRNISYVICDYPIEYSEDLVRVENVIKENLQRIKESSQYILMDPQYVGVSKLADSSVNLRIIARCKEENIYQTERDLNRVMKLIFDENNINIPFNQIVVNYRDGNNQDTKINKEESK